MGFHVLVLEKNPLERNWHCLKLENNMETLMAFDNYNWNYRLEA
jgi:hypothetical protein